MPKWDKTRNYYADLELQPSASADEIKRQFKKLALKYHPDRNPGREAEVNPKFQVIQSAHEILTDETLKRQYDEARRTYSSRYPGASGVRGNPWQDVAKAYPPPPRRQPNPQPRPAASGASRYESFFASGVPQSPRPRAPKDDPQFRKSNAEAWDHIRPGASRRNTQTRPATPGRAPPGRAPTSATRDTRPGPAPVPPRTAYQKQKQDAAFGTTKKAGFTSRPSQVADEPSVTNKNYFTNRTHSNLFTEPEPTAEASSHDTGASAAPDPFAHLRDQFADNFTDNRKSTPYHTPGGERTSLFDSSSGLGRSTSTRTPPRPFGMPGAFPRARPRSSSPTRSSSNDGGSEDSVKIDPNINGSTTRSSTSARSRASERYKPQPPSVDDDDFLPQQAAASKEPSPNSNTAQPNGKSPSVYASQTPGHFPEQDCSFYMARYQPPTSSSEDKLSHTVPTLLPMERDQRRTLDRLVRKYSKTDEDSSHSTNDKQQCAARNLNANHGKVDANSNRACSFNFRDGSNTAGFSTFARNSTENINTRFVNDEMADDWQFKAGSVSANEATTPSRQRPQSRNRPNRRQTPLSNPTLPPRMPPAQEVPEDAKASDQGFSAGVWNEQIGPQHFEPQSMNNTSTSPTRRTSSRKSKTFKMTAGTAAVVDEESESPQDDPSYFTVPDAMDIDTPPIEKTKADPQPVQANSARPYFAEPHRKDWRAGDTNGVAAKAAGSMPSADGTKKDSTKTNGSQPAVGVTDPLLHQHVGSEDTGEFRTNFSDFKNVEPFAEPRSTGLGSFADLCSTLPFKSQPSEHIPFDVDHKPLGGPLNFPIPPVAPRLPPTMGVAGLRPNISSFRKYAQEFNSYMEKWEAFNTKVITHFSTREEQFKSRRLRRGASWLEDKVPEYLIEVDQDLDVQKKYLDACTEHRKKVAEFMDFRDRVR
ncbi:hypothetical protein F4678DRAFT_465864 [Xylaria arbuscula]|nr:hypothetical protein F4678DRAFT_465864 [Xylaria arbuscula]